MSHDFDPGNKTAGYPPIENEFFIAGQQPNWIEDIAERTDSISYWEAMEAAVPEDAETYQRNQQLLNYTYDVIAGNSPATGRIADMRDRCELYFNRLGSCNRLTDDDTRQRLPQVAGRYLELTVKGASELDASAAPIRDLPVRLVSTFDNPESRKKALEVMSTEEKATMGTMLFEIAQMFDSSKSNDEQQTIRNRFEAYALSCFGAVINDVAEQGKTLLLTDYLRNSWSAAYDIRFQQIRRIPNEVERNNVYSSLLQQQAGQLKSMLGSVGIPQGREADGLLYEYYLPILVRSAALVSGQQERLLIRKSLPREDSAVDGSKTAATDKGKYNFDFLLSYPDYGRRVFLQAKIGRRTHGYSDGISVFNYHAGITELRPHMVHLTALMEHKLSGQPMHKDEEKTLRREFRRVGSLLPREAE